MDADERLTALKKAYADIILNTAKEAAARIMVSERKALKFQQELYVAKEEAVQMLLRLKNMMDSKISEAAVASLSQQKKIEELEAQLQEAEDIVNELRQELREVQTELERATKNKEQSFATLNDISEEKRFCTSQSIPYDPPESHQYESVALSDMNTSNSNEDNKCYNVSYVGNLELPSIILRSKEPELYRNGCTQRICACDGELSLSREPDDVKPEESVKEDEEVERICTPSAHEGEDKSNIEKHEETKLTSWQQVRSVKSLRRNRKRVTKNRKKRTPAKSYHSDQVTKMDQTPYISCTETNASSGNNIEPSQMGPELSVELVKVCDGKNTINNVENLSVSTESLGALVCEVEDEKVDVPLVKSKEEASGQSNGVPSQPVNDKIIKYQRKRKRETVSNSDGNGTREKETMKNGNGTIEKGPTKRKTGEKLNGSLEAQISSLVPESTRDSRRLAQVARQLISLSEKKW